MVKVLTTVLSFLLVAGCSIRNYGHDQDNVLFEEHKITADEKSKVEQRINSYNQFVDSSFFKRNGIFLVYDTESDVASREDYIFFLTKMAIQLKPVIWNIYRERMLSNAVNLMHPQIFY